ncbi:MAG: 50S ribosomal protein L5 [Patescibacteria group bacterium]
MSRLLIKYRSEIAPKLQKEFGLSSIMAVPKMTKIVISSGAGQAIENPKFIDTIKKTLTDITGQAPVVTRAKKAIAGFKLRANLPIGVMVTLRHSRMYEFLDRFINASMGRIRDFHGISPKSFDSSGNLNIGIKEHNIFPEISTENLENMHGLQVTIVFNSKNRDHNFRLMQELGLPFEKSAK